MQYKIKDNFLNTYDFKYLQDLLLSSYFAWYYQPYVTNNDTSSTFFCHKFFDFRTRTSEHFERIEILLSKLKVKALIRVKANLYINEGKMIEHPMHKDYDFSHQTSLLFINTNNGYTFFEDGTKIESVENRLLTFDGSETHASTTCTDETRRISLAVNYF